MISESQANITDADCEGIVNTVNCVGVMGGGVAKAIREKYPWCFSPYRDACESNLLQPGGLFIVQLRVTPNIKYPQIINMATKNHWRGKSRLEWVDRGLENLSTHLSSAKLSTIAIPRPGCGLGGLNWADVKPLIEKHLGKLECEIIIHHNNSAESAGHPLTVQTTLHLKEEE